MTNIKGTETEKNLLKAFAGESQARNRYSYFAKAAKKEGYVQISEIFAETAEQERAHAKRLFKFLTGGELEITAAFPAGVIGTTVDNLKAAAAGEHFENVTMYPEFAETAAQEGLKQIAAIFKAIAVAEGQHEKRYLALAANIETGQTFKRQEEKTWVCKKCGYVHKGTEAPGACPACGHPQAYFELLAENW
ncbi:MAG: rubrerythrin family protein [Deltaproteobacteria bacterium]|nr:rubrerythrin family protein [Deltaproteobacteria bacterium]